MSQKSSKRVYRHERSDARRLALQIMYQSEIVGESPSVIVKDARYIAEEGVPSAYAERLLRGVEEHRDEIDDMVRNASENWALSRMPVVDRSLLRLATYEMLYVDEVPLSVSINEAVELAKGFGGDDESHRFVNGILGKIARVVEERAAQSADVAGKTAIDIAAEAFANELAGERSPIAATQASDQAGAETASADELDQKAALAADQEG